MTTRIDNLLKGIEVTSLWGLRLFLLLVLFASIRSAFILFLPTHGRSHRWMGGCHFLWIILGALIPYDYDSIARSRKYTFLLYDVVLGVLGTITTLTAARDFPHKYVKNADGQSGSLSKSAIVTQGEMKEHAFYQVLNIVQALYLHGFCHFTPPIPYRLFALLLVTSPWWFRRFFPVHSFSDNWKRTPKSQRTDTEVFLYMIKKTQYLFYKHFVLHGLNISFALHPSELPLTKSWRIFWLHLNTSYVMEFFLQSLVKRRILSQQHMLWYQRLLIFSATLSSITPLTGTVRVGICFISLALNFCHRHHDVFNTMLIAFIITIYSSLT